MSDLAHLDDLAHTCVTAVQRALGIELDFTQDTLPILDHYVSMAQGTKAEVIELLAPMAGAYFGEVLRRGVGPARWHAPGTDYNQYRLEFESAFLHFNPVGMVVESILGEAAEGWNAHLQMLPQQREPVQASLDALGGVRDSDYFRLSLRFEAVEQVYLVLSHLALTAGEDTPYFSHEVYEATLTTGVVPSDGHLH
jgi:hypothetical protein